MVKAFVYCGVACLVLAANARLAHADVFEQFTGVRSFAMGGAHRGLGNSNEALWLNPGGMALSKRYSIDLQYGYGRDDGVHRLTGSVVDSKSGPVAGGFAYSRDFGSDSVALNRTYLGAAYGFADILGIGLTGTNVTGGYDFDDEHREVSSWNGTAGVAVLLGEIVGLGVTYQNILGGQQVLPTTLGFGASLRTSFLTLAGDVDLDFARAVKNRVTWRAGGEIFFYETVAIRGGWHYGNTIASENTEPVHAVSAGLGVLNKSGGLNAGFEHGLGTNSVWSLIFSFQFFM